MVRVNGRSGQEGRTASSCQILLKSVKRGRDVAIFRFFIMAAAAIWDFRNFTFLTVGTAKRVELRHGAKFHQNRSICGHVVSFPCFQSPQRTD